MNILRGLLFALTLLACNLNGWGQGTVNFNNLVSGSVDAKIFVSDGLAMSGTRYAVQLYGGAAGSSQEALVAIGIALNFRTGSGAGYLSPNGTDTTRAIPGVAPGSSATIQLRVWDTTTGSSWETAWVRGNSTLLTITTGGAGSPPSLPANLVGLQSFAMIPEPSTISLGALGMGAVLMVRRRKS